MAVLIHPDGTAKIVRPNNGTDFTNDELHELVNGYWETTIPAPQTLVFGGSGIVIEIVLGSLMVVNEDGKNLGMPMNRAATSLLMYEGELHSGASVDLRTWGNCVTQSCLVL